MPEATYKLSDLQRVEIRENARYAWDSGYRITVLAPEVEQEWRYEVEQWLVNNAVVYTTLKMAGEV